MSVLITWDQSTFGGSFSISKVQGLFYMFKASDVKFLKRNAAHSGQVVTVGTIIPVPEKPAATKIYPIVSRYGTVSGSVILHGGGEVQICFPAEFLNNTTQSLDFEFIYTGTKP